jgi:cytosine/adenosine deaminase-related metal-dependent hydrolase
MRHRAAGAFVLVLMTAIVRPGVRASGCEPELIAVNGRIYTVDAAAPWVEALAVCNGRIVQTGPTREIEPLARKSTRRIDLAGRTVLPGFNDSHVPGANRGNRGLLAQSSNLATLRPCHPVTL